MKTRLIYLALGAALALTLSFGALAIRAQSSSSSTQPAQKWEYMVIDWLGAVTAQSYDDVGAFRINGVDAPPGAPQKLSDVLNQYGAEGWELVGVESHDNLLAPQQYNAIVRYIFKRPAQ